MKEDDFTQIFKLSFNSSFKRIFFSRIIIFYSIFIENYIYHGFECISISVYFPLNRRSTSSCFILLLLWISNFLDLYIIFLNIQNLFLKSTLYLHYAQKNHCFSCSWGQCRFPTGSKKAERFLNDQKSYFFLIFSLCTYIQKLQFIQSN